MPMVASVCMLLLLAVSYRMIPYFIVLLMSAYHCYWHASSKARVALSLTCVAVTWFYIIRFMATYSGPMNAFDAAYADVIWGGAAGNWGYTQSLLSWAVVATIWSSESSVFYTLFGVLGAMSGSYLLYDPEQKPRHSVPAVYAVSAVVAFLAIFMLPRTTSETGLGWWLWVLHVCIIAPKVISMAVSMQQVDRCYLYAAVAMASFLIHVSAGQSPRPSTDCQISITVDAGVCAGLTLVFIFERSNSISLAFLLGLLQPLVSPGCVLATFCALELGFWSKLVTALQRHVAERLRAKDSESDKDGRWQSGSWMNLGYWKGTDHYDTACRELASFVGDAAKLQKSDRLLCVACGKGDELRYFQEKYNLGHVAGLDAQEPSLSIQCELAKDNMRLVGGDANDIREVFCTGEFNRIIVVDAIYHLDKAQVCRDFASLLPDGGTLSMTDVVLKPGAPFWIQPLLSLMGLRPANQWTETVYREQLESFGFSSIAFKSLEPFVLGPWLPTAVLEYLDYVVVSAAVNRVQKRPKAAVIGSGLSGLAAARLLANTHEVTVFEARKEPGFAGWEAKLPNGSIIDIPLRMIEFNYWKRLVALCRKLGVPLAPTNFTVSLYGPSDEAGLVKTSPESQVGNIFKNIQWYFGLVWAASQLAFQKPHDGESLGKFACRVGQKQSSFYRVGVRRHFSWILSCPYSMVDSYPLELIREFFLQILGNFWKRQNPTVRVFPSVRCLQETLLLGRSIRTDCPAPPFEKAKVIDGEEFDIVVVATEANAVSKVVPRDWTRFFDDFQYHPSHVFVHRDTSLMPENRADWRALNVCDDTKGEACQITVWVNAYYDGIDLGGDVFETVNPRHLPKPELVIRECHLQRVVHTASSADLQARIAAIQGREGFYFCGAYAVEGLGLLEQALYSAQQAAAAVRRDMVAN
eukprot:TRINITY_DN93167_c0_g1_i1.p1 TRINITY_DN93167_c0_g1~~TRINITY_DN93167_c0_g1_i1.p1  ORF type:complete len:978 (+),score=135.61 TRINITY_DN93167_c0_g1_i1:175-2934(+)